MPTALGVLWVGMAARVTFPNAAESTTKELTERDIETGREPTEVEKAEELIVKEQLPKGCEADANTVHACEKEPTEKVTVTPLGSH